MMVSRAYCLLIMAALVSSTAVGAAYAQNSPPQAAKKKSRPVKKPSKELLAIQAEEARRAAQARIKVQAQQKALPPRAALQRQPVAAANSRIRAAAAQPAKIISQPQPVLKPISTPNPEAEKASRLAMPAAPEVDAAGVERQLQEAAALMKAGKQAEAYALLEPLEFDRSGDVKFDYLIGNAALASGQPDKATLAFERVLAVDPNFIGARLDMARAYYQLGDLARSKSEFDEVMKHDPPEVARITIQKYLDAIEAQLHASDTRVTAYVEASIGHDTNVNSASTQTSISVFNDALTIPLTADSIKTSDNYSGLTIGLDVINQSTEKVSWYAGADVQSRSQNIHGNFNWLSLAGRAGMLFTIAQQNSVRVGILAGAYELGSEHYRDSLGVNSEWIHAFSQANQMALFGQQVNYRYADEATKSQDFNQSIVGAGWTHIMQNEQAAIVGSMFYGQERDVDEVSLSNPSGGRADGSKEFTGARVGAQTAWNDKLDLFVSAGAVKGTYGKYNSLFLVNRSDKQYDLTLGGNWHWNKYWSMRPQIAWSRNRSNILIYSYDRVDASLTIRRSIN